MTLMETDPDLIFRGSTSSVVCSICYALQPSKLLHKLEERSAKGIFLGVDYAGYKVLDLQSNVAYVARTLKVSKEENRLKSRLVAKKNEHRAVYRLKVAWWQKDISRNQESTIMTLLHLLETKLFSDSSSLLPCILDTNFTSWTSTLPVYMGT